MVKYPTKYFLFALYPAISNPQAFFMMDLPEPVCPIPPGFLLRVQV
jgi:hypothetical protein